MSKSNHGHHPHGDGHINPFSPTHIPYWKRAHTDWRFWIGVLLMLAAISAYVSTLDLAERPGRPPLPVPAESAGK
ncbi:MAG: hypothetical protein ABI318_09205 [Chthoniobacteraceae bacterium]